MNKTIAIVGCSLAVSSFAQDKALAKKRTIKSELDVESFSKKVSKVYLNPYIKGEVGFDSNSNRATNSDKEDGPYAQALIGSDIYTKPFTALTLNTNFEIGYREAFSDNNTSGLLLSSDKGAAEFGFDYELNDKTMISLINEATITLDSLENTNENENSDGQHILG